ncbi:TorD/DmsD family molecular chaperone [Antarctobacter heliothermus]|uniref:Chaperone TorD involved in molybdoenzyme TorA maturation n=1 Tax=Antarctobacter heliothermus TaxID=74033 RepID=A0A239FA58_9RHOB|nr:molecular chaperone TorD family protein [Antarctobacter heliothermus]SNS53707.1 chaperone TorD involved in molybdoenzyme TorA maturation [Antarctobacter heliothermus]
MTDKDQMTQTAQTAQAPHIADEDRLRADLYNYLGLMLSGPPDDMLLAQTAGLSGDDTEMGRAIGTLAKLAKVSKPKAVTSEYNKLFIGLGRGELLPYASYYLTGFLNEKPLALLRQDMTRLGLERADTVFEPEDNIASLMEMMGAMIVGRFGPPAAIEVQRAFFNKHIGPWAAHFFGDLEGAKNSVFYTPFGTVGRLFMLIEAEAFRMSGT